MRLPKTGWYGHSRKWSIRQRRGARRTAKCPAQLHGARGRAGPGGKLQGARGNRSPRALRGGGDFGVAPGADVFELYRLRMLNGVAVALDTTRVPLSALRSFRRSTSRRRRCTPSWIQPVQHSCGPTTPPRPSPRMPSRHGNWGSHRGAHCSSRRTTSYDASDRMVELGETVYRSDRYRFRATLVRKPQPGGGTIHHEALPKAGSNGPCSTRLVAMITIVAAVIAGQATGARNATTLVVQDGEGGTRRASRPQAARQAVHDGEPRASRSSTSRSRTRISSRQTPCSSRGRILRT